VRTGLNSKSDVSGNWVKEQCSGDITMQEMITQTAIVAHIAMIFGMLNQSLF
jgi:hypothetical protein